MKLFITTGVFLLVMQTAVATELHVPAEYPTIQQAIEAANDGDTILVADGTYSGFGNKEINPHGKLITIQSENGPSACIIECNNESRGFILTSDETPLTIVSGFTIQNCSTINDGGGFYTTASPTIENCIYIDNSAYRGGGLYASGSPVITDCVFLSNEASLGGAVALMGAMNSPQIGNCRLISNTASSSGGGLYTEYTDAFASIPATGNARETTGPEVTLAGCEIFGNYAGTHGGGCYFAATAGSITKCRIGGNQAIYGAGIFQVVSSECAYRNTYFSLNNAYYGGGLYLPANNHTIVLNCGFVENSAEYSGGGCYVYSYDKIGIWNSIFFNNANYDLYTTGYHHSSSYMKNLFFETGDPIFHDAMTDSDFSTVIDMNLNSLLSVRNIKGDPLFLEPVSGIWTSDPSYDPVTHTTSFFDDSAVYNENMLQDKLLRYSIDNPGQTMIISNTENTVIVHGDQTAWASAGDSYRIDDYHLQNGSAAIDRAVFGTTPEDDIDFEPRPGSDMLEDIGPDETDPSFIPSPDITPPVSCIDPILRFNHIQIPNLVYHCADDESDVEYVTLYYRYENEGWTAYSSQVSGEFFEFDASGMPDGYYSFTTIAMDTSGNEEEWPEDCDTSTVLIRSYSAGRVYVDLDAEGYHLGTDWIHAQRSLQTAIDLAYWFSVPEIWVGDGIYRESIHPVSDLEIYGGFEGWEDELSERNYRAFPSVLDGVGAGPEGTDASHVVLFSGVNNCRLDGFVIRGGKANYTAPEFEQSGGGVFCYDSGETCSLANCLITGNEALYGAGVCCGYNCDLQIIDCWIMSNIASYYGGGLCFSWNFSMSGNVAFAEEPVHSNSKVVSTVICNNQAQNGAGFASENCKGQFDSCLLVANKSSFRGGAVHMCQSFSSAAPTSEYKPISGIETAFVNSCIAGNTAPYGAGFYAHDSNPQILNSVVTNNIAEEHGGAVGSLSTVEWSIINCVFTGNLPDALAALANDTGAHLRSCLFHNNGDADYFDTDSGTAYQGANAINLNVQNAFNNVEGDPSFQIEHAGSWSHNPIYSAETGLTTLTDESASFAPDALIRMIVNPDLDQFRVYVVWSNSETEVVVPGDLTSIVQAGDYYAMTLFHLLDQSCALDRAELLEAVSTDFEGDARPGDDGLVDIGRDEAPSEFEPPADVNDPVSNVLVLPESTNGTGIELHYRASDAESGLDYVDVYFSRNGINFEPVDGHFTSSPVYFDATLTGGEGMYCFYSIAHDHAGNVESPPATYDAWTNLHFPTPTPTRTPTPTSTSTHSPTPTATPTCGLGVRIEMPLDNFHTDDTCFVEVSVCNPSTEEMIGYPLFVILSAYGSYYWAPSFNTEFDWYLPQHPSFQTGLTRFYVIEPFPWPDTNTRGENLIWYAAMTDPAVSRLHGDYGYFQFGWNNP